MSNVHERGFTLVEMMVVIGIIGIMSGIVFVNYRGNERQVTLDNAAAKVAQDIRKVMELSLRASSFPASLDCPPPAPWHLDGYGIFFDSSDPNSYLIFANCSKNNPPPAPDYSYDPSSNDELVETIPLDNAVEIVSVSSNPASIFFLPPNPTVYMNNSQTSPTQITVTLRFISDPSKTKSVIITNTGTVRVQ